MWPDALLQEALGEIARSAQAECGGRATPDEKIHVTLFFVGHVERSRIDALKALAASVVAAPFDLKLAIRGYWRHNRIVWVGTRDCPAELAELVEQLQQRLTREGIRGDERPYVPHVTLVRDARRAPAKKAIPELDWRVSDFVLLESVPTGGGVRYDVLACFPLVPKRGTTR